MTKIDFYENYVMRSMMAPGKEGVMEGKKRLNLLISEDLDEKITGIRTSAEISTKTQVIVAAVNILHQILERQQQGEELAFVDKNDKVTKVKFIF